MFLDSSSSGRQVMPKKPIQNSRALDESYTKTREEELIDALSIPFMIRHALMCRLAYAHGTGTGSGKNFC